MLNLLCALGEVCVGRKCRGLIWLIVGLKNIGRKWKGYTINWVIPSTNYWCNAINQDQERGRERNNRSCRSSPKWIINGILTNRDIFTEEQNSFGGVRDEPWEDEYYLDICVTMTIWIHICTHRPKFIYLSNLAPIYLDSANLAQKSR